MLWGEGVTGLIPDLSDWVPSGSRWRSAARLMDPVCTCRNTFTEDSNFCRICGAQRGEICLDGVWQDGSEKSIIQGLTIQLANGETTAIEVTSPSTFTTVIDDRVHGIRLDWARQRLLWSSGSVWERAADQATVTSTVVPNVLAPAQPMAPLPEPPSAEAPSSGRFTSRRMPRAVQDGAFGLVPCPPGRLEGAIYGMDGDPFSREDQGARTVFSTASTTLRPSLACFEDLPAFRHLAALEEAVSNGSAMAGHLPALPVMGLDSGSSWAGAGAAKGTLSCLPPSPRSARSLCGDAMGSSSGPSRMSMGAGMAAKTTAVPGSRVLFREGMWGIQPPALAGAKNPAGGVKTFGFGQSALRGTSLQRRGRGPAATARWLGMEGERLRAEPSKPLGSSAHVAFMVNGGPERIGRLNGELCAEPSVL